MQTPRTEFGQALKAIATERGLEPDVIIDTIKQAIIAAYKRDAREHGEETEEFEYDVDLDSINGEAKIFSWLEGKPENRKDVTPPGFGRIAAQTAKQVIHQKIKEAEQSAIMDEYTDRVGGLISGMILRFDGPNVRVDLGRTEGIMPVDERAPNERLNPNQRLSFLLKELSEGVKGRRIILSRADKEFVKKLFEREVPEIGSGSVVVKEIAREAGVRTKIAVQSSQGGVDPVGSCVGQKGVRVQAVTNELGGERVDIVPWNEDVKEFIIAALSPAEGLSVRLVEDEQIAYVKAPEDQLSLAIGKDGQNARLASKLTGWKIEVETDGVMSPKDKSEEDAIDAVADVVGVSETKAKEAKKDTGITSEDEAIAMGTYEKKEEPSSVGDDPQDDDTEEAEEEESDTVSEETPEKKEGTKKEEVSG